MLMETQDIQDLFHNIDLDRPAKKRKLLTSNLLESASGTEGPVPTHHSPSKRPREGPSFESSGIPTAHLVPIGVVGFDPLFSSPTILHCTKLFHNRSCLKVVYPNDQLQILRGVGGSLPVHSDQYSGFIALDSQSNLGQLVPWPKRTLNCQIFDYIDDVFVQFSDNEGNNRVKQSDLNST